MKEKIRYGIIGRGGFYKNGELVTICNINEEEVKSFKQYDIPVYKDYLEMLDKEKMELVIIRTPPPLIALS